MTESAFIITVQLTYYHFINIIFTELLPTYCINFPSSVAFYKLHADAEDMT
jgi:hypothetical protein